ncbi:acyl carrier protein [Saccharothrix ecbatanensis]|uniref:Acyl carrier protein n=1 Tax=Saccharothrix ecbatanensis TaxID=1105145 RepID=A0A7W9HJI6_9PSEU|nr:phosphopantetheine-binding protein [Saccharothrix ecbatanensis]MBB5802989.1 acyl carrier protein [Saccharothrix ecbatanensis]
MIGIDEVIGLIKREMRGKLPADITIDENSSMDDLGLSSLQVAEIVFTLEEDHGVEFDAARAADARTLGDLVALGNDALSAKSA